MTNISQRSVSGRYRKKQIEVETLKLQQKQAWEWLYQKPILELTDWSRLAERLDDILTEFIEQYEAIAFSDISNAEEEQS